MTTKQILGAMGAAVAVTLVFVLLFALPVSGERGRVVVNDLSETAYKETIVPYFLDKDSKKYNEDVSHFLDDYSADREASEYCEVYMEVDLKKWTIVPFQKIWVGVENIPEAYKDYVVCVTTGPLMSDCEKDSNKGNLTLLVRRQGLSDEELLQMAQEISLKAKWTLAMGVDGWVHFPG